MTTTTQPQAALTTLPAAIADGICGCETQYSRSKYYVTVPADRYAGWREVRKIE